MANPINTVLLSGGTGGAKLARGLIDVPDVKLTVIANTGDDLEIYGAYVSPDPDLVSFWLADQIDERGWGLDGDTFTTMDALRETGDEIWFNLGDRDLAIGQRRANALRAGARLTTAHAEATAHLNLKAPVLPMSDQPVRTKILANGRWWGLQQYMIVNRASGEVEDVQFRGAAGAEPSPEVLTAIDQADVVIIGPSNPIISIGPILAIEQLARTLRRCYAPVVAVSPIVGGEVLKGPTADFLRHRGVTLGAAGLAELYGDLLDGIVADEPVDGLPTLRTDLLMSDANSRARLARETVDFASSLEPVRQEQR